MYGDVHNISNLLCGNAESSYTVAHVVDCIFNKYFLLSV
jgi:hypothetical protein